MPLSISFSSIWLFVILALQKFGELALGQHGGAAEIVKPESHGLFSDFGVQILCILVCALVFQHHMVGEVLQCPYGGGKVAGAFYGHLPVGQIPFAVDAGEPQFHASLLGALAQHLLGI